MTDCQDSAVGIPTGYGLHGRGVGVQYPAGARDFSLLHNVLSGSGAHQTFYPIGIRGAFSGGKAALA
jgi:hypothetical protein